MKRGFSLIEVVFAIVIIAISLMSVPMMLKQSAKSEEFSIIQEVILATATKMDNILSYPWDKNSYDTTNKILRTLDVSSGDSELARVVTAPLSTRDNNLRVGQIYKSKRRRFFDYSTYTSKVPDTSINNSPKESINDFYNKTFTISGSGAYDYKDSGMSMVSKIYYVGDSATYSQAPVLSASIGISSTTPITNINSTNIKMIEINATSPMLNKSLILRSYMFNIGQSKLLTRTK